MSAKDEHELKQADRLVQALVEQLKVPLIHIAHSAERRHVEAFAEIELTTARALQLIDSYLLSLQQRQLELEPVSLSSVLYDVAQTLDPLARQHNADLEISVAGRYRPVMAHHAGLAAGLTMLGQSLLEADSGSRPRLVLSVYRGKEGIAAGVFGDHPDLTPSLFRQALKLYGQARQPLPSANSLNGAGLYVAHSLFERMQSHLKVSHHTKLTGLAAHFLPSAQLQLV